MRDILTSEPSPMEPNPVKRAQIAMARHPLPKRFYKSVDLVEEEGRFALKLDGRGARTPARQTLSLPTHDAGKLLAAEWSAQVETINPDIMPVTRIVNSALDGVANRMKDVRDEILRYAGCDLVCYHAETPLGLVEEQTRHWQPVLQWAEKTFGERFVTATGIIQVEQSRSNLNALTKHLDAIAEPVSLACLHVLTTLSGSSLIALMLTDKACICEDAWQAATVDERWNIGLWGTDEEAETRMKLRAGEFRTAHALWVSLQSNPDSAR